ncbi:MAG: site-specific integrase [Stappiaceae bacterium]
MPTIRKLNSGRFNVQIRTANQPSKSATFDTYDEAQAWIASFTTDNSVPVEHNACKRPSASDNSISSPKFIDLARQYCNTVLKGRASYTIASYRLEHVASRLPEHIGSITKFDINEFRLERLTEVSGVTCRDELQLIKRVYRWAHRELILDAVEFPSPVEGIPIPPPGKPRSHVIERNELEKLLSVLSPLMRQIVELAYETAMRRAEILKLTPKVINLKERYLDVIDGKTGDRAVPLNKRAVELLSESLEGCSSEDCRLFPIAPHSVTTAVRRARKKAGLSDNVRMHQMRHSRITIVARRGLNQAQIMMVSGHRDSRSVQRYTHLNVRDVLDHLDE